ncbi:TPM domain-containing protein [Peptoniphilus raoultii]|uniref:TPM domain-containing protein n=1 Tax=Peptoniphilus raoultii TaxID=1776387 RepID=UPI0008D8F11A|nr:TPM domain-containing protein [Peptoniphilus raoultii]
MKKKLLVIFLLITLITLPVFSLIIDKNQMDYNVYDRQGILSEDAKSYLNKTCYDLQKKTGGEIAIVIIPTSNGEDSKTYATEIFDDLDLGEKGKDNGCLLLLLNKDRQIQIEPGYGAEGFITDAKASRIYRRMAEIIQDEEAKGEVGFEKGILYAYNELLKLYEEEYDINIDERDPGEFTEESDEDISISSLIILMFIIYIIFRIFGSGGGRGGRKRRMPTIFFGPYGGFGGGGFRGGGGFGGFGGGGRSGGGGAGGGF